MMSYQKRNITNGDIFHILNRGTDKRKIFLQEKDYARFVHNLYEFNDDNPLDGNLGYFFEDNPSRVFARPYMEKRKRKLLVDILAFCLMPNHYHLLLRQRVADGISKFVKRLNMGYAKYFNQKYNRDGSLFQGRYKSIAVTKEAHFLYMPYYIHLNPLDLVAPEWRERSLNNFDRAWKFLSQYRWSSHLDYLGEANFPSVTQRGFLMEYFGGPKKYHSAIKEWLKNLDIENLKNMTLE